MKINSLLLAAATSVSALCFAIPDGQPEGVYSHTIVNGTDVHVKIAEPSSGSVTARSPRTVSMQDQPVKIYCGRALNLNHEDTDGANADIDRQCGNGGLIGGGYNFYAIRGGTVAFVCNFGHWYEQHRCYEERRLRSGKMITDFCGLYNSGWADFEYGWISYGYDTTASDFCGTGLTIE